MVLIEEVLAESLYIQKVDHGRPRQSQVQPGTTRYSQVQPCTLYIVQPGTVLKIPIMCYIFEKQALQGYLI